MLKTIAALLAAAILPTNILPLSGSVEAQGYTDVYTSYTEEDYATRSLEDLLDTYIRSVGGTEENIGVGYRNLVTGEEYFFNADRYFIGASIYKAPLNMYLSEQVRQGLFSYDDQVLGVPYDYAQRASLTYSNNPYSLELIRMIGGWREFRRLIADYVDGDAEDEEYIRHGSMWNAREMTNCMSTLGRDPERFPRVLDCLLDSAPGLFLKYAHVPYEIAQKYGNVHEGAGHYFHAAGVVYTSQPFALVILSCCIGAEERAMGGVTEICCHYTQYRATGSSTLTALEYSPDGRLLHGGKWSGILSRVTRQRVAPGGGV